MAPAVPHQAGLVVKIVTRPIRLFIVRETRLLLQLRLIPFLFPQDLSILYPRIYTMCDYTQREYSCGHFRWIASKWCREYTTTHKRCQPNVTHFEYRAEELCGTCVYHLWNTMLISLKRRVQT